MKNIDLKALIWFVITLITAVGCSDEIAVTDEIGKPQYDLPRGEAGSVDEMIYSIHEKYGSYILYSFEKKELTTKWTADWNKWYIPADLSADKKYVRMMLDVIEQSIFSKFEDKFIRDNFPYKILFVDTLFNDYQFNVKKIVNMLSNGQEALVIGNVGKKMDRWQESDRSKFSVELNNAFTLFYYTSLPVKPVNFINSRGSSSKIPILSDPEGVDSKYEYSCWIAGYITGAGGNYSRPAESEDFGAFVAFLTGTPGREINRRLTKYPLLKDRTLYLYPYLTEVVHMDVVANQNKNCPSDKLSTDFFDQLR